jgi:hypothetical protein
VTENVKLQMLPRAAHGLRCWLNLLALVGVAQAIGLPGCKSDCSGDECSNCSEGDCGGGAAGSLTGRFSPCKRSSECDEAHGFECVDGECSYACRSHADCVEVGHCGPREVAGQRRNFCVRDEPPPAPGELYTRCPRGDECADGFLCVGAGEGDLDAYCTRDCERDSDCAQGFYCGVISRGSCEAACNLPASPDERCVPVAEIGQGKPWQCGDFGVVRSVCRAREFCAPCDSDADCLGVPNQLCARDESGEKICTRSCDTSTDSCPWGNAARCGTFDDEVGQATCSHRFGSCSGSGKTCEPCRNDADCPTGVCTGSNFTGERWCVDLDVDCRCPNGADATGTCANGGCPDSPSGLTVLCIDERSSGLFGKCYASNTAGSPLTSSPQTGCWPEP